MQPIFLLITLILYTPAFCKANFPPFYHGRCNTAFEGNPADCTTYFQCNFGDRLLRECPPGLHWNPDITGCDWPQNLRPGACTVQETQGSSPTPKPNELDFGPDPGVSPEVSPAQEETLVLIDFPGSCDGGTFIKNPNDCSTYYICDHGHYIRQKCGSGLHWNSRINTCDWPASAKCTPGQSSNGPPAIPAPNPPQLPPPAPAPLPSAPPAPLPPILPPPAPPVTTGQHGPPPLPPRPNTPWTSGKKLICYFTDWAWYRPLPSGKFLPSNIDPNLCTHIVYAFALLNGNDFVPQPADSWADIDNGFYQKVTSLKSRGTIVTLALGGWNDSGGSKYSILVNDPAKRAKFIEAICAYLKRYNFDGLDLDWEYPKCWQGNCPQGPDSDKISFGLFVKELRDALPPPYILSAAVSASKPVIDAGYDVPTLSRHLDWIGVMDYDFHGSWDKVTGHIAPLYYTPGDSIEYYNVDYSINYWLKSGASADKLVLGIPLYGQSFTLASSNNHGLNAPTYGPGEGGPFTRQGGVLSYYEICSQKWNVVQSPNGTMGPYGYNGNQWVSYDDIPMVTKKAQYIKDKGLAGGMIWALDMDDFTNLCGQGKYPLLTAIANTLKI